MKYKVNIKPRKINKAKIWVFFLKKTNGKQKSLAKQWKKESFIINISNKIKGEITIITKKIVTAASRMAKFVTD